MVGILSTILSVAVPVARVASQVMPILLDELGPQRGRRATTEYEPVVTGMLEWVPVESDGTVYCTNTSYQSVVCTFEKDVELEGAYGVESESFEILPRNAVDVTQDMTTYGETGSVSANYMDFPTNDPADAAGGAARRAVVNFRYLAPLVFTLFGGSVGVERGTEGGRSFWRITSNSRLLDLLLDYRSAQGTQLHVEAKLRGQESGGGSSAEVETFTYQVDMPEGETSTGMLTNFSLTLIAEEASFKALLTPRESISIDELPAPLRSRVSMA